AKGVTGTRAVSPYNAGLIVVVSYSQIFIAGSLNESASRPKPGIFAVHPKPEGLNSSIVTSSVSPGAAPSIKTGPVTGLSLLKSSCLKSSGELELDNCPPDASRHSNSTVVLTPIRNAGAIELSQPK